MSETNAENFTHQLSGTVANVKNKADITVTVDGKADNSFQFVPATGQISTKYKFTAGTHKITVTAKNECGQDTETTQVIVKEPCSAPVVKFSVSETNSETFTHELSGKITNMKNKADITVTVDGKADNSFQFIPGTGQISSKYKFTAGSHKIIVIAKNECGQDTETAQVIVKEPCFAPVIKFTA